MTLRIRAAWANLVLFVLLANGCGGGSGGGVVATTGVGTLSGNTATTADISVRFMGNSHTSVNNLSGMVAAMLRAGTPSKTVNAIEVPGWMFLEERLVDAPSINLLRSQKWSFVVL